MQQNKTSGDDSYLRLTDNRCIRFNHGDCRHAVLANTRRDTKMFLTLQDCFVSPSLSCLRYNVYLPLWFSWHRQANSGGWMLLDAFVISLGVEAQAQEGTQFK